jgi:hypothetical protein
LNSVLLTNQSTGRQLAGWGSFLAILANKFAPFIRGVTYQMESMVKSQIKIMYVVLIALFLSACASTIKQQDLQSVKTVGVINNFPENPNFVTIGTTIFNNDYASIKDDKYSELLVKTVLDYVKAKGMIAKVIDESDRGSYDMVLELIP